MQENADPAPLRGRPPPTPPLPLPGPGPPTGAVGRPPPLQDTRPRLHGGPLQVKFFKQPTFIQVFNLCY